MISEWQRWAAADTVLLEGFHAVKHALRFGATLPVIVTSDRAQVLSLADTLAPDLADLLAQRLQEVDAATYSQLANSTHHTRVAALARRPPPAGWPRSSPAVFLDEPRHLGNYGAVVRVAAGLGAAAVLSTGTVDPWHPVVLRGSAGLHFALPVLRLAGAGELPGPLFAFDDRGADARRVPIPDDAVLAFGSERRGLSAAVLERADRTLALPMRPGVASYNLATAVAMALYQWALTRS